MAELGAKLVGGSNNANRERPGTQHLAFMVNDRDNPDEKLTLFSLRANPAAIRDGKVSAFWEAVRTSMHAKFDVVTDVEKLRTNPKAKGELRPYIEVEGLKYEKAGFTETVKSRVNVPFSQLPYKWNEMAGAFCYDPATGATGKLQKANVSYLIRAIKIQLSNPDTVGSGEGGHPRILNIPGVPDQDEVLDGYEANLKTFESWAADPGDPSKKVAPKEGKIVDWQFEEVIERARR